MKTITFSTVSLAALLAFTPLSFAEVLVKSGETIAFLGDSITQAGASRKDGYVRLIETGLQANEVQVKIIGAGVAGNKSNQMLDRLQKSVLDQKPDWMALSCGVNDVWHGDRGIPLEEYRKHITAIVDRCKEAGVKVIILTATPIQEQDNKFNATLAGYNAFLKELAKERNLPLADLNAAIWTEIKAPRFPRQKGKNYLTFDGVHMNPLGNWVMAEEFLKTIGLNPAQQEKARLAWNAVPARLEGRVEVTLEEYQKLSAIAVEKQVTLDALMSQLLSEAVKQRVSSP